MFARCWLFVEYCSLRVVCWLSVFVLLVCFVVCWVGFCCFLFFRFWGVLFVRCCMSIGGSCCVDLVDIRFLAMSWH